MIAAIMGVLILLGGIWGGFLFRSERYYADRARYFKSIDDLRVMSRSLEEYKAKYGAYPEMGSWEAMIAIESPLVAEGSLPKNMSQTDFFGRPFSGFSNRSSYRLGFQGPLSHRDDMPPVVIEAK
jgi:hypothetical protein